MHSRFPLFVTCCVLLLSSCKEGAAPSQPPIVKGITISEVPVAAEQVRGTYTGDFKGSPIAITFRHLAGKHISGYNVHKGLKRNLTGTIELSGSKLHIQVSEPGTNPYDGNFDIWIDTLSWRGKGRWKPMDKGEEVNFTFKKNAVREEDYLSIYTYYEDSLRNSIELKSDGSCIYAYVPDLSTQQQHTLRGSYKLNSDSTLHISWQKNVVFPSGKSAFRMKMIPVEGEEDLWVLALLGETGQFMQYWP